MTIKKITLQNFQVIKDFDASFDGNVYLITGDNELGKSTLLKAIGALLTGKRDDVLRNGEDKGFAKIVLDGDGKEYEVKLSYTKANPRGTLTITSEGKKSNNISKLNQIFGYTDFDAVEFSRWSETAEGRRKQVEVVKRLLPIETLERIEEIDRETIEAREARRIANAKADGLQTIYEEAADKLRGVDVKLYEKPFDVSLLMEQQAERVKMEQQAQIVSKQRETRISQLAEIPERIKGENERNELAKQNAEIARQRAKDEYEQRLAEIEEEERRNAEYHKETLEAIETERADFEKRKSNADKWLSDYEAVKANRQDIETIIVNATKHNEIVQVVADVNNKRKALEEARKAQSVEAEKVEKLKEERHVLVSTSKLPIEGLTFTEDGLELNGVPFIAGKVSDSQIMEVAVKLIIASNEKVKVFRIARGESLGAKRLQAIVDIAKANGFQGFIEQVQRGQNEMIVEEYQDIE